MGIASYQRTASMKPYIICIMCRQEPPQFRIKAVSFANDLQKEYIGFMEHCDPSTLLRESNVRATARKRALLAAIMERDAPFSAHDLYEQVSGGMSVDLATVYRTLSSFEDAGVVRQVESADGVRLYEIACRHNPVHPHFRCERCRKIECLDSLASGDRKHIVRYAGPAEVREIAITFTGICRACRQKEER